MPDTITAALSPRDRLISAAEIVRDLSISLRSLEAMVRDGRLPHPVGRIGRGRRWELRSYLAARARLLAGSVADVGVCAVCATEFPRVRADQQACSGRCRTTLWRRRRAEQAAREAARAPTALERVTRL